MILLAPAGNFDALKSAIYNGADEVYLGINQFNARNNIDGFTIDGLKEAVDFAHVFNVKVLVAVNILFSNEEIQSALDLIVDAYNIGADAFIVQDIGLISLLNRYYPQITIHASTQMAVHNLEGVRELEKLGVKRVVLARETPLKEIKRIKDNSDIEIEYFVHGALCVSFSGNCYLSSYKHGASGNRGKCKQLCRLPYTLYNGTKKIKTGYLLSAKDFSLINRLDDLKNAGVSVLKIEGRARRSFYVATVVSEYKKALNNLNHNDDNLKLAFNRNFTEGYFNGNSKIISSIQNHIGIEIGRVEKVNFGKRFNEVVIYSNRAITKKSTLKILGDNFEEVTISAFDVKNIAKDRYLITTTNKVGVNWTVRLIVDGELETKSADFIRKLDIKINIDFLSGKRAKVFTDYGGGVCVFGDELLPAKNQPITKLDILNCFSKSEYFNPEIEIKNLDKVFITKQQLNELRRRFFNELFISLTKLSIKKADKINLNLNYSHIDFSDFEYTDKITLFNCKNVIYSPEIYDLSDIKEFVNACKIQGKTPFLDLPNYANSEDVIYLKNLVEEIKIAVVVNNLYALSFNTEKIIGPALNVYNDFSAKYFNLGVISAESNDFVRYNYPFMTFKHCPIKEHVGGSCSNCLYTNDYKYKSDDGKEMKLTRKKITECTFYLK